MMDLKENEEGEVENDRTSCQRLLMMWPRRKFDQIIPKMKATLSKKCDEWCYTSVSNYVGSSITVINCDMYKLF